MSISENIKAVEAKVAAAAERSGRKREDILLLAVTGFGAGFPGVIYVLARSLLALAAVSIIQLLRKKLDIHSEMPLAPFLLFGALI